MTTWFAGACVSTPSKRLFNTVPGMVRRAAHQISDMGSGQPVGSVREIVQIDAANQRRVLAS